jgi:leucyl aminopeptidase
VEIEAIAGDIEKFKTNTMVLTYFEDSGDPGAIAASADKALEGHITQLIKSGEIKGKSGEITVLHSYGRLPSERIAIMGMGKKAELTTEIIRKSAAETLRFLRKKGAPEIGAVVPSPDISKIDTGMFVQSFVEGALLGLYSFRKHITKEPEYKDIARLTIIEADEPRLSAIKEGCAKGRIYAEAAIFVRDMVNEPANYMTPTDMADAGKEVADTYGLKINIFDRKQMQELSMGAMLGVCQGSDEPPKFIVLRYKGNDDTEKLDVGLVGKGITFDSGGLSLKPSEGMGDMKGDMAGGSAVMAVIGAIARLKIKTNLIAVIPTTENMPSGHAFKPGDVLTAMNGKTIEVISTDAEGRLIMADALAYTKTFDVGCIIDVATLTGSCHVALADVYSGVFGNNQELINKIIAAGNETGELMWQLPMHERYKDQIKSDIADVKNTGSKYGGAVTAAKFLEEFVGNTPWVHIDIAGTSDTEKEEGYLTKGGTGIPVRTLIRFISNLTK